MIEAGTVRPHSTSLDVIHRCHADVNVLWVWLWVWAWSIRCLLPVARSAVTGDNLSP